MSETRFVYVTYIRTTPEKPWRAPTTREFLAQYWPGARPGGRPGRRRGQVGDRRGGQGR